MAKRVAPGAAAVFVAWVVMDLVIHGAILGPAYASQPELWRPESEIKMGLIWLSVLVAAVAFTWIYGRFVRPKSLPVAVGYGALWGVAAGVGMGYGTYAVMPIPYVMALVWCLGVLAESLVGGLLVGWIVKE